MSSIHCEGDHTTKAHGGTALAIMGNGLHTEGDAMAGAGFVHDGGIPTHTTNPAVIFMIVRHRDNGGVDVDWVQANTPTQRLRPVRIEQNACASR